MTRKRVLVLNPPTKFREIRKVLGKSISLVRGFYRDIEMVFTSTDMRIVIKGKDLRNFDFVWVTGSWSKRDLAKVISLYLTHHNRPHTVVEEGAGVSKLVDMTAFSLAKLAQPRSYYCYKTKYLTRAEEIATVCKFPLIAKDVRGTFGRRSFLARDLRELKEGLFNADEHTEFIFQEYIDNDYDWGIIVGNGEVLSAEKSYREQNDLTFMNHASGGATEIFVQTQDVPSKVQEMAIQASRLLGLTWARSDILVCKTTGKPYILETNRSPRMTSKSTEVQAFAEYINAFMKTP